MAGNHRIMLHREDRPAMTIAVGPKTNMDAVIGALQLLIPAMGYKLVVSDPFNYNFHTGSGQKGEVIIARDEA